MQIYRIMPTAWISVLSYTYQKTIASKLATCLLWLTLPLYYSLYTSNKHNNAAPAMTGSAAIDVFL